MDEQKAQAEQKAQEPRPVFAGDWAKASGQERQAHMTVIAAWKARNGIKGDGAKGGAQGRTVEPTEERARRVTADDQADLAVLDAVIAAPKSLASDKIRAVEARQRILGRQKAEAHEQEHGGLVALRSALDLLPTDQRVDALSALLQVEG